MRKKKVHELHGEMHMDDRLIVFTDLDGTLLDYYTYSYEASREGIELLKRYHVPLIFCTSKSYAEVIYFREKTGNKSPFIVENGGAIYIPKEQFEHFKPVAGLERLKEYAEYVVLNLGADYDTIRQIFELMKKTFNDKVIGFGDMSVEQVAQYLNLEPELAAMAKIRHHDEPFILKEPSLLESIKEFSKKNGLQIYAGTRFYHLMGNTDKGTAVKEFVSLYRKVYDKIITAAIGEGKNDEPMFRQVDMPFLVKKPDGSFTDVALNHIIKIYGIGPSGFTLAVKELLNRGMKL